jgi:outer membrane protein assembly factor BamB
MDDPSSRRRLLAALAAGATGLLAGCDAVDPDVPGPDDDSPTATPTPSPTPTATPPPTTDPPTATPTPTDTVAPTRTATATPTPTATPPPQSETPRSRRRFGASLPWELYQLDVANTGTTSADVGTPQSRAVYWQVATRSSSPVVRDGRIFTAEYTGRPRLVARNAATGRQQFSRPLDGGTPGTSPALAGAQVLVPTDGRLEAFDRFRGSPEWSVEVDGGAATAPAPDGSFVFHATGRTDDEPTSVYGHRTTSGERAWRRAFDAELGGSVATYQEFVVAPVGSRLVALDRSDGDVAWDRDLGARVGTPSIDEDDVFAVTADGRLTATRATTGGQRWEEDVPSGTALDPPAVGDDRLFVGAADGVRGYDASTGNEEFHVEVDGPMTAPTRTFDAVYAGSMADGSVVSVDPIDREVNWTYRTAEAAVAGETRRGVTAPPIPVTGGVLAVAADGITALGPE